MEIGIDEIDDYDYEDVNNSLDDSIPQNIEDIEDSSEDSLSFHLSVDDSSLILEILKDKGITDPSRIKFETDNGGITELSWDSLNTEDKLNILTSSEISTVENTDEDSLDDSEILLINTIRSSKMSPNEYINYILRQSVDNYINNMLNVNQYTVNDLSDDELFITDIISKVGEDNITNEEVQDMLTQAKSNPSLFLKQVDGIRKEYLLLEDNNRLLEQEYNNQMQIEQYNRFAETVENEIRAFTELGGYELNMDESEMEEVYDFISGFDDAGISFFSKALNDPKLLVRMAWFALNGEQAIQDINDYWTNEIKTVRENSYKKGIEDGRNKEGKTSNLMISPSSRRKNEDYLDDDLF